jgi:hypothetical protein
MKGGVCMKQRPVVIGLLLCEQVVVEEQTRPGSYQVALLADNEMVAHRKIVLTEKEKSP